MSNRLHVFFRKFQRNRRSSFDTLAQSRRRLFLRRRVSRWRWPRRISPPTLDLKSPTLVFSSSSFCFRRRRRRLNYSCSYFESSRCFFVDIEFPTVFQFPLVLVVVVVFFFLLFLFLLLSSESSYSSSSSSSSSREVQHEQREHNEQPSSSSSSSSSFCDVMCCD